VIFVPFCNLEKENSWVISHLGELLLLRKQKEENTTKENNVIFINIFCWSEYQQAPVDIQILKETGLIINKHMTSFSLTIGQRDPCDTSSRNNVSVFIVCIALVLAGLK